MNERLKAFKTLLGIGVAFAAGYILGSKLAEKKFEDTIEDTLSDERRRMEKEKKEREETLAKEHEELEADRKTLEEEKEHFNEVKHQLYSDLTKEEQLAQLCDPDLGVPVDEDDILRYNRIKRQYLRLDFIDETMYGYGQSAEYLAFDSLDCKFFKDGTIYTLEGDRIDEDDSHVGNLCSGMGTGKGNDIRYIRNWAEGTDYCITYDPDYETGEDWYNEWLGDVSEEEPDDVDYDEEDDNEDSEG